MKCLSIRQPWAWLIAAGHKDIENRTWKTSFRGECLIHASAGMTFKEYIEAMAIALPINKDFLMRMPSFPRLLRGGIIGKCTIHDVVTASQSPWFFGPVGFCIRNAVMFSQLHPLKGQLSFFEVDEKTIYHTEHVICPGCGKVESAIVEHTLPFYSYVHECNCGYVITESEWEEVKGGEG